MSFFSDVFYLVEPSPEFADQLLGRIDADFADFLLLPRLFRSHEGGNSDWLPADREARAKLVFLASLREYDIFADAEGFAAVFGSAEVSVSLFDRWFRLRRLEIEQELDLLEPWLRDSPLRVELTGRYLVDRWLSSVRNSTSPSP